MALTTYESHEAGNTSTEIDNGFWWFQGFTAESDHSFSQLQIKVARDAGFSEDVDFNLYASDGSHEPTGAVLSQGTMSATDIPVGTYPQADWVTITMTEASLTNGQEYCFVFYVPLTESNSFYYVNDSITEEGYYALSIDEGSSWFVDSDVTFTYRIDGEAGVSEVIYDQYDPGVYDDSVAYDGSDTYVAYGEITETSVDYEASKVKVHIKKDDALLDDSVALMVFEVDEDLALVTPLAAETITTSSIPTDEADWVEVTLDPTASIKKDKKTVISIVNTDPDSDIYVTKSNNGNDKGVKSEDAFSTGGEETGEDIVFQILGAQVAGWVYPGDGVATSYSPLSLSELVAFIDSDETDFNDNGKVVVLIGKTSAGKYQAVQVTASGALLV